MSKLSECFLLDNTGGIALPLYDGNLNGRTYWATRYGVSSHDKNRYVNVPLFPFTDIEVDDRCVLLLLAAVNDNGWQNMNPHVDADEALQKRNLRLHRVLTSADHHLIPLGHRIAVAEPEHLGRLVESNGQRGVTLFTPEGVVGCKKKDRTAYEVILAGTFI